jgi:hypothetical protein
MADRTPSDVRSVFSAHNDALLESAEQILRERGVEYDVTLEAVAEARGTNTCFQRLVLQVPAHRADESRRLLQEQGFGLDLLAS